MEKTNFTINSVDYHDNDICITCEGIDDQKLAHFGGLDLTLKAARVLIASTQSPMSFPEKNGDHYIREKVVGLLLNEVGELLRNTSHDSEYLDGYTNIELVKEYLGELLQNKVVSSLIETDEAEIRKFKKKLDEEENKIWARINDNLNNK